MQQSTDERIADPEEHLDRLDRLERADNARQHAEDAGFRARGRELRRRCEDPLGRTLALSIAAAILYVVANAVPMLGLTVVGRAASTTVIGGAQQLWHDGRQIVAVLVLFTASL